MRFGAVVVLCLTQFVDVLGVTSAITALPKMLHGVGAPASATGLVATSYAMLFGGLLIVGARAGDRYGARRILIVGLVLFALAGLIGAFAGSTVQLVVARSLQGAAAALSVPSALRLLLHITPEEGRRHSALAAWSATGAMAGALGFLLGGAVTQLLGWPAVFWVNAPVGLGLAALVVTVVPSLAPVPEAGAVDVAGTALCVGSVMAIVVGCSLLESASSRLLGGVLGAAGLVCAYAFARRQRRAADPLIPLEAFRSRNLRLGTFGSFVNTATTGSAAVLATLVLQDRLGETPFTAGLTLLPLSLAVVAGSTVARGLLGQMGAVNTLTMGLSCIAGGDLELALTYGARPGIIAGAALIGLGLGIASVAANQIGTDVPQRLAGSATGIINTGAQLGTALGVAVLVLVASGGSYGPWSATAVAWAIAAAGAMGAALVLRISGRDVSPEAAS